MKVERIKEEPEFIPIQMTLETEKEAELMKEIISLSSTVPGKLVEYNKRYKRESVKEFMNSIYYQLKKLGVK